MWSKKIIKEKILVIFDMENRPMNIREVTGLLNKKFGIKKSPQIIRKHLEELIKERKLRLE